MFRPRKGIVGLGLEHFKTYIQTAFECNLYVSFRVFYSFSAGGLESSKIVGGRVK